MPFSRPAAEHCRSCRRPFDARVLNGYGLCVGCQLTREHANAAARAHWQTPAYATHANARAARGFYFLADPSWRAIPRTSIPKHVASDNRFTSMDRALDALSELDPYGDGFAVVLWRDARGHVHASRPDGVPTLANRAPRTAGNPAHGAVARGIARRYHDGDRLVAVTHAMPFVTGAEQGMGPLVWLEVIRPDGRLEKWTFRPMPRLFYDGANHLWIVGGSYKVDGRGFRNVKGTAPCHRRPVERVRHTARDKRDVFRDTHGGLEPREGVTCTLAQPDVLVEVGQLRAAAYRTDKGDGDKVANYRHDFAEDLVFSTPAEAMPRVYVDEQGQNITLVGGRYSIAAGWIV